MLVTYAQNNEDVLLYRCFKTQPTGFYIDIGAWHPDTDNVTRLFYGMGWHGINVEPDAKSFATLQSARPRDINLQCLIGEKQDTMVLHRVLGTGMSTTSADEAAALTAQGHTIEKVSMSVRTLTDICAQYAKDKTIDFLKIDVEGMEESVIRGMDWTTYRPRVLVIEATKPNTSELNNQNWAPLVIAAGYTDVYFDGLNKFYVRNEDLAELAPHFALPVNLFDQAVPVRFVPFIRILALRNKVFGVLRRVKRMLGR